MRGWYNLYLEYAVSGEQAVVEFDAPGWIMQTNSSRSAQLLLRLLNTNESHPENAKITSLL